MSPSLNLAVFHLINGFAGRPMLDRFVMFAMDATVFHNALIAAPYVILWFHDRRPQVRVRLALGLMAGVLAILIARTLAHVMPFEVRPAFAAASGFKPLSAPLPATLETWSAFPSDNAAFTLAVALGLYPVNRRLSIGLSAAVMVIYGVFRVYAGVHYPADILAGWMIGAAAILAVQPLAARTQWVSWIRIPPAVEPVLYGLAFLALCEYASMFETIRKITRAVPLTAHLLHQAL